MESLPTRQQIADQLTGSWVGFCEELPRGDGRWIGRTALGISRGGAMQNSVLCPDEQIDDAAVDTLLDEVAAIGLPHSLWARPAATADAAPIAARRGLTASADAPLLAVVPGTVRAAGAAPAELTIRRIGSDEAETYIAVSAAGFGSSIEHTRALTIAAGFDTDAVRCYVGEVDGTPVVTALAAQARDAAGIFNVTTLPTHRRRGYGAAITARAVADAFAGGAAWAWLQSTPAGYPLYVRLGFTEIERWHCWATAE